MFHEWGHQFIYDEETLANSMHAVEFHSVRRCRLGESSFLDLQDMEKHGLLRRVRVGHTDRYRTGEGLKNQLRGT